MWLIVTAKPVGRRCWFVVGCRASLAVGDIAAEWCNIDDGGKEEESVEQKVRISPADSVGILIEGRPPPCDEPEGVDGTNSSQLNLYGAPKNLPIPPLLNLDPDQQQAAVQMTHYLNTLMCMVSEHFTSLER